MFADPALQREYDRKGYVVVDLIDEAAVSRLHSIWEQGNPLLNQFPFSATIMSPDPAYRRGIHQRLTPEFREPLARVMPGFELLYCMFNNKRATGPNSIVGLHQDWSLVDESRFGSVGIFCPLVDVDETNGCLFVVDGSHRIHTAPRSMYDVLPFREHEALFLGYAKLLPMRAGQACIHSLTVFHGSVPNVSQRPRLAAGVLAVEKGSEMRHFRQHDAQNFEELAVDREFFFDLCYGMPPQGGRSLGMVSINRPVLSPEQLREQILTGLRGAQ